MEEGRIRVVNVGISIFFIILSLSSVGYPKSPFVPGVRPPTPQEEKLLKGKIGKIQAVQANQIALQRYYLSPGEEVGLPSSVKNYQCLPKVGNQGAQGSCAAWSSCYYYKTYQESKEHNWGQPDPNIDPHHVFSPAFGYNLANGGYDGGSWPPFIMSKIICDHGCATWQDMPYRDDGNSDNNNQDDSDCTWWPSEEAWRNAVFYRAQSVGEISLSTDGGIGDLKQHLANGDIAVIAIVVHWNFYNTYPNNTAGIDNQILFDNSDTGAPDWFDPGGHAMTVIGYDDSKFYFNGTETRYGAFLIANSWGDDWAMEDPDIGTKGFCWVSYDYMRDKSYQVAWTMTDRQGYAPTAYGIFGLDHNKRGEMLITFEGEDWYFICLPCLGGSWYKDEDGNWHEAEHPINQNIVVDLTQYTSYFNKAIQLGAHDLDSGEGGSDTIGRVTYMSAERGNYLKMTSVDTPKDTIDGGLIHVELNPLRILSPTQSTPVNAGSKDNPNKISVRVQTLIPGLTKSNFHVLIGGALATIVSSTELSDRYVLEVMPPTQDTSGLYDLTVMMGYLLDTETNAVEYEAAPALPDLTVTSVNAPDFAEREDYSAVSFTVENQGDVPSGPFHYLISLSSTNPWGTALPDSPLRLGIFPMDSVATDLPSSVTKSIQIPNDVPLGDYYVTVYADCFEVIDEGINEGNNIGSTHPNMISIGPTDTTPPTIITKIPESNATNVPITTNIQIVFSEPMNQSATEGAFSIIPGVAGSKSWQGNTFVFNPTADLEYQKIYKIIISSLATDLAGNPLAHTEWSFTTIKQETTCFFADLDCDGDVDTEDVRRIALHWDTQMGDALYISDYDFYSDGRINLLDVRKVAQYWGQTAPFSPLAAPPLAALMLASTGAETAIVKVNPPTQEIAVGTTSTISIEIEDVSNLGAIEFTLRYNPSIIEIQADSVEIGDFLPKNRILPLGPQFKDVDGLRELTYGLSLLGNEPGPSGNGILARITVKALGSGTTTLNLRNVRVVDATLEVKRIPVEIKDSSIIVLPDVACESELQVSIQNSSTSEILPPRNRLLQNYPNPFNSETWIPYQLAESSNVQIKIYNISGQLIRILDLGYRDAGYYQDKASAAYWDGRGELGENVASGLYFYILKAGKSIATRRMVIAK